MTYNQLKKLLGDRDQMRVDGRWSINMLNFIPMTHTRRELNGKERHISLRYGESYVAVWIPNNNTITFPFGFSRTDNNILNLFMPEGCSIERISRDHSWECVDSRGRHEGYAGVSIIYDGTVNSDLSKITSLIKEYEREDCGEEHENRDYNENDDRF